METTHWNTLERLFSEACDLPPDERATFIEHHCADDPDLGEDLASLLAAYDEAPLYFERLADTLLPFAARSEHASGMSFADDPLGLVGSTLSHYEILSFLDAGGMGVVYKARDVHLDRLVALKLLPPDRDADADAQQRFTREAKAASALDHPNICTIYEIDRTEEGQLFIAMAYYEGETLKERIARGPLEVEEALEIAVQLASGLERAHAGGIIHRDLKPSNVLLTADGDVKILDFGLAKLVDLDLTQTPMLLGTVPYMAPEQIQGPEVDARADLWSLGVVLYEMLTGEHPFQGDTKEAVFQAIQFEDPTPLWSLRPEIPEAINTVLTHVLAKDRTKRYASAAELHADLERCSPQQGARPETRLPIGPAAKRRARWLPSRARWLRPQWIGALVLLFSVLVVSLPQTRGALWSWVDGPALPDTKHLAVLPFTIAGEDPSDRAFRDGLTEALTDKLTQLERSQGTLSVVPASDVRSDSVTSAREAREQYQATLAVMSSLQRTDDRLHLTLDLVDTETLRPLRSDEITRSIDDVTAFENTVALTIAELLGVSVDPATLERWSAGETRVPRAYESYLQGRGYLQRAEPESIDTAIDMFDRALEHDADYALAYAGLGEAYWHKYDESSKDTSLVERAVRSCERAVALNDQLVPAYVTLGRIHIGTGQYADAVEPLRRATKLDPLNVDAYLKLAWAHEELGHFDEAESAYQRAIELRPNDWNGYYQLGLFYYYQNRLEEAVKQYRQAVARGANKFWVYSNAGAAYFSLGRWDEAGKMYQRSLEIEPNYGAYSNLGTIYFYEGRYFDAAHMYEQALSQNLVDSRKPGHQIYGNLASAHYWAGEAERAQATYERAVQMAEEQYTANAHDPNLLCRLAEYRAMLGAAETARSLLHQAAALAENDANVMFCLGTTFEHLNEREQALAWIERALEDGFSQVRIEQSPTLRELRNDTRYQQLLLRVDSSS